MEFGSGSEEDQLSSRGKLSFSYSSSSSPSSSSSLFQIYQEKQSQQQQMAFWLGNKYHPVEDNSRLTEGGGAAAAAKLEVVKVSDGQDVVAKGDSSAGVVIEKEHMFDKVVTPSDVGKLNRLVIPKQHAEKYFPLDSSANEKGLLLNFEDRSGKPWRFRYSYWNSSQSYVMTKGWSRFVKEKKLDAGDVVSFQRGVGELGKDRLYIDWRRCPDAQKASSHPYYYHHQNHFSSLPLSPLLMRPPAPLFPSDHLHFTNVNRDAFYNVVGGSYGYRFGNYRNVVNSCASSQSAFYKRSSESAAPAATPQQVGMGIVQWELGGCGAVEPMVYESVPVVQGKVAAKKLRLFGVNMDCPIMESADIHECSNLSSTTTPHASMALQHTQLASQSQHHPQLRLYNGTPVQTMIPSTQFVKGKPSMSMSLDLDI